MNKLILVPDILPNNLRIIRDMRGITIKKVAKDLKIDRNFLSAVETESKNFSGKTTIRAMKYYDISFYHMYDVKQTKTLPCTYLKSDSIRVTCTIEFDIDDEYYNYNSEKELLSKIKIDEKEIKKKIKKVLADENELIGEVDSYNVNKQYIKGKKIIFELDVDFYEQVTEEIEFNINFVEQENKKLAEMLRYRGFSPIIEKETVTIDGLNAKIENDVIVFNKEYKFANSNNVADFDEIKEISINDVRIDKKIKKNKIISVSFYAVKKEINNLKAIRTLLNLSVEEMHTALGLSYNGYINLELGNQKISSKIMWRLVTKLRVPLELIINIDEYFDRYCLHDKKIRKPRKNKAEDEE